LAKARVKCRGYALQRLDDLECAEGSDRVNGARMRNAAAPQLGYELARAVVDRIRRRSRPSRGNAMRLPAIAFALAGIACSNTIYAKRPLDAHTVKELNDLVQGHEAVVLREDDSTVTTSKATIGGDSLSLDENTRVPTAGIERITVQRRGLGMLEGLGFGFLGGAIAGALAGAAASTGANPDCNASAGCLYPAIGAVAGGLLGILVGPFVGALIGHHTTIEFGTGRPAEPPPVRLPGDDFILRMLQRESALQLGGPDGVEVPGRPARSSRR
jgi:hypothetical protein